MDKRASFHFKSCWHGYRYAVVEFVGGRGTWKSVSRRRRPQTTVLQQMGELCSHGATPPPDKNHHVFFTEVCASRRSTEVFLSPNSDNCHANIISPRKTATKPNAWRSLTPALAPPPPPHSSPVMPLCVGVCGHYRVQGGVRQVPELDSPVPCDGSEDRGACRGPRHVVDHVP